MLQNFEKNVIDFSITLYNFHILFTIQYNNIVTHLPAY